MIPLGSILFSLRVAPSKTSFLDVKDDSTILYSSFIDIDTNTLGAFPFLPASL